MIVAIAPSKATLAGKRTMSRWYVAVTFVIATLILGGCDDAKKERIKLAKIIQNNVEFCSKIEKSYLLTKMKLDDALDRYKSFQRKSKVLHIIGPIIGIDVDRPFKKQANMAMRAYEKALDMHGKCQRQLISLNMAQNYWHSSFITRLLFLKKPSYRSHP